MKSPLGYREAQAYPCIAVQEGGPNSLAAIAHAWASGVETRVAPICMPSANSDFTAESLRYLQGKRARIFADNDATRERGCPPMGCAIAYGWTSSLMATPLRASSRTTERQ